MNSNEYEKLVLKGSKLSNEEAHALLRSLVGSDHMLILAALLRIEKSEAEEAAMNAIGDTYRVAHSLGAMQLVSKIEQKFSAVLMGNLRSEDPRIQVIP